MNKKPHTGSIIFLNLNVDLITFDLKLTNANRKMKEMIIITKRKSKTTIFHFDKALNKSRIIILSFKK
jgi:hypothetical protein